MVEALKALHDTPLPTILVVGGLIFLLLSIATLKKPIIINVTPGGRKLSGFIGGIILVVGIALYLVPAAKNPTISITTTPTSTATPLLPTPTVEVTPSPQMIITPTEFPSETPTQLEETLLFISEMIQVPSGEYTMGSSFNKTRDYSPAHAVYVDEFYIDKFEVTNAQYTKCVDSGFCAPPSKLGSHTRESYFDDVLFFDYPVVFVTWNDAKKFCEWRNGRLPTEAEWEKAAKWNPKTNETAIFPWGQNNPSPDKVNYASDDTTKVGLLVNGISAIGGFDMAGNVMEWVYDSYDSSYYEHSPERNPTGPISQSNTDHVVRGGAWSSQEDFNLWTFYRFHFPGSTSQNDIGFRCASDEAPISTP